MWTLFDCADRYTCPRWLGQKLSRQLQRTPSQLPSNTDPTLLDLTFPHRTDANLLPLFKRTFDVCNGESGVLTMKDGAQGDNGRLIVKVRSSSPCGVDNPAKQVCH
ncbi:hypothetical protein PSTT_14415 [Puccinia striiformis]|uniref:Uncharacterized protein n=1 Tax=Puccinia striiformis TaxID=27350 RepID=A0A2S4UMG7_9BASI|nr:hypothetical protein PSTT_14415 [Puccinia striiformis]